MRSELNQRCYRVVTGVMSNRRSQLRVDDEGIMIVQKNKKNEVHRPAKGNSREWIMGWAQKEGEREEESAVWVVVRSLVVVRIIAHQAASSSSSNDSNVSIIIIKWVARVHIRVDQLLTARLEGSAWVQGTIRLLSLQGREKSVPKKTLTRLF